MSEKTEKGGIQVISRAASILRVLKNSDTGMSLGQIASKAGLPRSTVQRITAALVEENFLVADRQGRGLKLGPELTTLAKATQYNIVEHCRLLLTELTQKTGETADLSALRGGGMVFLDQVPGTHRLTTVSRVGEVFPLTSTANGRACLAQMPEAEALALAQAEWSRTGTQGDPDAFLTVLATIRRDGLAYDRDEHSEGISACGFAFRDWNGDLHAISVPVPSSRFLAIKDKIEQALLETSASTHGQF